MKTHTHAFILAALAIVCLSGCSLWPWQKKQVKSESKIIDVGDPNPNIVDAPAQAGTTTRKVQVYVGQ